MNPTQSLGNTHASRSRGDVQARIFALAASCVCALLTACTAPLPKPDVAATAPVLGTAVPAPEAVAEPIVAETIPGLVSEASTARDYRRDGAHHIYGHNRARIFKGQLPPLMYAVGVLDIHIDRMGRVSKLNWTRPPTHAPEVVREIERTVYAAAPFPAPLRLGGVTYTDVWLWDKSGKFQLDTLTEGQRRK